MAMLVGAGLAMSGAALAILLSGSIFVIQGMAIFFGICAVIPTYSIGRIKGGNTSIYMLVLAGIITSALFEALISIIKYVADPFSKLPAITYWLMGSVLSFPWN